MRLRKTNWFFKASNFDALKNSNVMLSIFDSGKGSATVSLESLYSQARIMGVRVEETKLKSGLMGLYYEPAHIILLDENLADYQAKSTLAHELVHAKYRDITYNHHIDSKNELRARRETPRLLFTDAEYALAEAMYDGDLYGIASELGVTVKVVEDYRTLVAGVLVR